MSVLDFLSEGIRNVGNQAFSTAKDFVTSPGVEGAAGNLAIGIPIALLAASLSKKNARDAVMGNVMRMFGERAINAYDLPRRQRDAELLQGLSTGKYGRNANGESFGKIGGLDVYAQPTLAERMRVLNPTPTVQTPPAPLTDFGGRTEYVTPEKEGVQLPGFVMPRGESISKPPDMVLSKSPYDTMFESPLGRMLGSLPASDPNLLAVAPIFQKQDEKQTDLLRAIISNQAMQKEVENNPDLRLLSSTDKDGNRTFRTVQRKGDTNKPYAFPSSPVFVRDGQEFTGPPGSTQQKVAGGSWWSLPKEEGKSREAIHLGNNTWLLQDRNFHKDTLPKDATAWQREDGQWIVNYGAGPMPDYLRVILAKDRSDAMKRLADSMQRMRTLGPTTEPGKREQEEANRLQGEIDSLNSQLGIPASDPRTDEVNRLKIPRK